ncbi:MAG: permease [Phycisphaerae bacterium SM23_33]|nr:MAG: permease [Phycisphaerae bacterium SM23_33]
MAGKRDTTMLISTLVMAALALLLLALGYHKGQAQHLAGTKLALSMMVQVFPLLFFALLAAGMVQALIPQELISRWIGAEAGVRGILLGTVAGAMAPGGPYVSLPIAAGLMRSGAGAGTMVAFLTGWSLWALSRLPMEIGVLGWRLTLIRIASTFFFPPIAGLIAHLLFGRMMR